MWILWLVYTPLIFQLCSAALFRKFLRSTSRVRRDAQNVRFYNCGRRIWLYFLFVCSKSTNPKLLERKWRAFFLLNLHNFLRVFTIAAGINEVVRFAQAFGFYHWQGSVEETKGTRYQTSTAPVPGFSSWTNFRLPFQQLCFGVIYHMYIISGLKHVIIVAINT